MARKSGTPSYSSYRGRSPRWKKALAAVLVLVCILSGSVLFFQRYLVYDEQGRARLQLPWAEPAHVDPSQVPELHIEEPQVALPAQGQKVYEMSAKPLTQAAWEDALGVAVANGLDSGAVTLRQGGKVYFDASGARPGSVEIQPDTTQALQALTAAYPYSVARLGCLEDPIAARSNVEELGLKNTGGYIFYDGANRNWLDPSKPKVVEYLSGLVRDAAELGFDELILTEFTFPTVGKLDKIQYPEQGRESSLTALLEALRKSLNEAGYQDVALSVELTREAVLGGGDQVAGIDLRAICAIADGIYVPCTPDEAAALEAAVADAGTAVFVPEVEAPAQGMERYFIVQ